MDTHIEKNEKRNTEMNLKSLTRIITKVQNVENHLHFTHCLLIVVLTSVLHQNFTLKNYGLELKQL